jgi:hypothetical protein
MTGPEAALTRLRAWDEQRLAGARDVADRYGCSSWRFIGECSQAMFGHAIDDQPAAVFAIAATSLASPDRHAVPWLQGKPSCGGERTMSAGPRVSCRRIGELADGAAAAGLGGS